MNLLNWK